jgi:uncharacterized damage-inducible protein DinB
MLKETFIQIYEMDLQKIINEVNLYENEADLWKLSNGITNSGGNLALHLIGNINHFFGANLGGTDYKRERDLEFSDKNVSREQLVRSLENVIEVLKNALGKLSDEDFQDVYPEELGGRTLNNFAVVAYMLSHLNYHLGQINYHRRLFSE